jgi:hypothetical protein
MLGYPAVEFAVLSREANLTGRKKTGNVARGGALLCSLSFIRERTERLSGNTERPQSPTAEHTWSAGRSVTDDKSNHHGFPAPLRLGLSTVLASAALSIKGSLPTEEG